MRLARIGIRRPSSQLGPALRLTTGRDNFYIRIYAAATSQQQTHALVPFFITQGLYIVASCSIIYHLNLYKLEKLDIYHTIQVMTYILAMVHYTTPAAYIYGVWLKLKQAAGR